MKKFPFYAMIIILSFTILPQQITAASSTPIETTTPPKEIPADVKIMLDRLDEIKKMDKSNLNSAERKELRKEVREIKTQLKSSGNGVYLSVGAIIIVILLLILIL
jgi:hypothetical protein